MLSKPKVKSLKPTRLQHLAVQSLASSKLWQLTILEAGGNFAQLNQTY
jgi:hypothetical protein